MLQLELTEQERETLTEVLNIFLSDLRHEITDTDRLDYRNRLKEQEQMIKRMLGKLAQP